MNIKSKKRTEKGLKRKTSKYRKIHLISNIAFTVITVLAVFIFITHIFTKKNSYREKGIDAYKAGNYTEAIEFFDKGLKINQWFSNKIDIDMLMYRGDSYMQLMDYDSANQNYERIVSDYGENTYDNDRVQFYINLSSAMMRYQKGDYDSTISCFNDAVERGYIEFAIYAANCYESKENYNKMKEYLDIYSKNFGNTTYVCYKYVNYFLRMNDYNNVLSYISLGKQSEDDTYSQKLKYDEILCYKNMKDYQKALELADSYTKEYPDDKNGHAIYNYLYSRINIDPEPVNNIFNVSIENPEE